MWDLIVSVPDYCLSFYFLLKAMLAVQNSCNYYFSFKLNIL